MELLNPGGHLAVLTFHSLEDRIVKRRSGGWRIPAPARRKSRCASAAKSRLCAVLGGGGIKPDAQEVERNPRARSAMLRGCEKLGAQGMKQKRQKKNGTVYDV